MKRIIQVFIGLLLSVQILSSGSLISGYVNLLDRLTDEQKKVLLDSYTYGSEHDLGLTLAAIAWQESNFGMYMTNLSDGKHGSYGPFHILLDYAMIRHDVKNKWDQSRLAERLLFDFDFSAEEALSQLKYWQNRFKDNANSHAWAIAAYNAGSSGLKSKKGQNYRADIKIKIQALQIWLKKQDNLKIAMR